MVSRRSILSWSLLALALLAWAALAWETSAVSSAAAARVSEAQAAANRQAVLSFQKRLAALAESTKDERGQLETFAGNDVVSIVTLLENSDPTKRVSVKVSGGEVEGSGAAIPDGSLKSLSFLVEASGSYQALMRQVAVFERLPLPSSIESVELQRLSGASASWRLTVRLRVLTTAPVSSS